MFNRQKHENFRQEVLAAIDAYEANDLPKNSTAALFLEKHVGRKAAGRQRAIDYRKEINAIDDVKELIIKIYNDTCPGYEVMSELGSSKNLVKRLQEALMAHFGVTKYDIQMKQSAIMKQYGPGAAASGGAVGLVLQAEKSAPRELFREVLLREGVLKLQKQLPEDTIELKAMNRN